ncbi:hypothetical protein Pyn_24810 [Prunus yedoensis var. nudiflora]|uniref:Uncharacterized protein n=1 Tax=Prunus yedoensis var. nudiflora TaxID=2094558 RepID=A0A314YIP3_PRUYE|nr:hypothetical protein Pyn_24810 [Prunus yedoensis var. nudiflora]
MNTITPTAAQFPSPIPITILASFLGNSRAIEKLRTLFDKVERHRFERSEVVGSVHEQVFIFGTVRIVRIDNSTGMHVIEDEVSELRDGRRHSIPGGFGSERRSH